MELILMDSNERATNPALYQQALALFGESKLRVVNLDWSDFSIPLDTGLLSIERKAVGDLLNSIADGRIFRQIEGMSETSNWVSCIVHGSLLYNKDDYAVADGRVTKWRGAAVRGALRSMQMAGCIVEMVPANGFLRALQEVVASVSKPDHTHMDRKRGITFRDVLATDTEREAYKRVEFIAGLPGIGRKKAEALMAHVATNGEKWGQLADAFRLLGQMGTIRPFEPALSEHWGQLTVKRIRDFFGLEENHYIAVLDQRVNPPVGQVMSKELNEKLSSNGKTKKGKKA